MAKIVGFRVRDEKFEIEEKVIDVHHVEMHVLSRAVGDGTGGELVAIYKVDLNDVPYVFNTENGEIEKAGGLEAFLKTKLNRQCVVEKTLVGRKEQIAGIMFMDGGK